MKLLVGLGNPGKQYEKVRHNLGFMALDEYAKKHLGPKIIWEIEDKFKAEILKITPDLWLVKPQTYMNNSGMAVSLLMNYYKFKPEDLIVVYDELDLPVGKIKVRMGGAAAGHHGVESIIESLGTDKFIRIRLGIGNQRTESGEHKEQTIGAEKYVLESFMHAEKSHIKQMLKQFLRAIDILLEEGLGKAQNQFN